MFSERFKKLVLFLCLAALAAAVLLQYLNSRFHPPAKAAPPPISKSDFVYHYTPPQLKVLNGTETPADTDTETNEPARPRISRREAEVWLAKHDRSAANLLAAFRAVGDTNYLNEAAANFPNDPQVELAVLIRNEFPEDRRKWLDLFKASSPSNSLANYLSAQDDFKRGKTVEAVQELVAASGKSQFQDYAIQTQLNAEELYEECGKSPRETITGALADMAEEDLPELATIKRLAQGIGELEKEYLAAGDGNSALNLAQIGMTLGDQISSGDSGKYVINQLVGMATDAIVLQNLDQNTAYDFLEGKTPTQFMASLKQKRMAETKIIQSFMAIAPSMTEVELRNYSERLKIFGELEAKQWAVQQHPLANP
jgi:hypothetical protein